MTIRPRSILTSLLPDHPTSQQPPAIPHTSLAHSPFLLNSSCAPSSTSTFERKQSRTDLNRNHLTHSTSLGSLDAVLDLQHPDLVSIHARLVLPDSRFLAHRPHHRPRLATALDG